MDVGSSPGLPRRRVLRAVCGFAMVAAATIGLAAPEAAGATTYVWNVDTRKTSYRLDDFAEQLRKLCDVGGPDVRVRFRTPHGRFSQTFRCSTLPASSDELSTRLVNSVSARNGALEKARRIEQLTSTLLPGQRYSIEDGTWFLATTAGNSHCRHGYAQDQTRTQMAYGRTSGEDAEQWTLVEAIPLRVLCPARLDNLYATVRAVGEPAAAHAVRQRIEAVS